MLAARDGKWAVGHNEHDAAQRSAAQRDALAVSRGLLPCWPMSLAQLANAPARWSPWSIGALLAITLLAAPLRFSGIEQWSLAPNEAASWVSAVGADLPTAPSGGVAGWLLAVLTFLGLAGGHSEGWLRLPFVCLGICAVPMLAIAVRPAVGLRVALIAATALAVHPSAVRWSQTAADPGLVLVAAVAWLAAQVHFAAQVRRWLWRPELALLLWASLQHDACLAVPAWTTTLTAFAAVAFSAPFLVMGAQVSVVLRAAAPAAALALLLDCLGLGGTALAAAALPGMLALAALLAERARAQLAEHCRQWQPLALTWTVQVIAWAPMAWLFASSTAATGLLLTAQGGERAQVRKAASELLKQSRAQALVVAAQSQLPSLFYYLQPRGTSSVAVVDLSDLPGEGHRYLLLTETESAALASDFVTELVAVYPQPGQCAGTTLRLLRCSGC